MSLIVKNVVAMKFMYQLLKFFICKHCPFCIKMAVLSKIKSHSDAVDYFKELSFYNKPSEKPKIKRLKNIN